LPGEASAIGGGDPDGSVEIEAVELGLTRAAGGDVTEVRLVAEAADAGAGPWPQRDAALDGGTDDAGQDRRDFGERVRRGRVVGGLQLPATRQAAPRSATPTIDTSITTFLTFLSSALYQGGPIGAASDRCPRRLRGSWTSEKGCLCLRASPILRIVQGSGLG